MFSKEDQAALEAANKVVLDKIRSLQERWFHLVMSGFDLPETHAINAQILHYKRIDAAFDKILANEPISQKALDLLLAEELLEDYYGVIERLARPEPASQTVMPCFVTSRQQLMEILSADKGEVKPAASSVPDSAA